MDTAATTVPAGLREAVEARVAERSDERRRKIELLQEPGGIALADDPARVATRIDRLSRYHPDVRPVSPAALAAGEPAAMAAAGVVLERIIQTNDLLGVAYLDGGVAAARAVGRISIRDSRGRLVGYGTGTLVSPELLLTNHHVLSDAGTAEPSIVEFDYQDGIDGRPLPLQGLPLDPGRFFLADERLDIALVAVQANAAQLASYGFNRLVEAEGKAIVGDFVTIIQHPRGEKKQIALRENRIVDVADLFLHYETDTDPGSSGSPVFNDQWEIVGLHHASVPAPGRDELGGIVNEGIRVSRLLAFLRDQRLPSAQQALLDRVFTQRITLPGATPMEPRPALDGTAGSLGPVPAGTARPAADVPTPGGPPSATPSPAGPSPTAPSPAGTAPDGTAPGGTTSDGTAWTTSTGTSLQASTETARILSVTAPFELHIRCEVAEPGRQSPAQEEAISIDPDYSNRQGYDPGFLAGGHRVPLPLLSPDLVPLAAVNRSPSPAAGPPYVLPYHHFSVVLNKRRRLAFFTAVNIDGNTSVRLRREPDRWSFDPRVAEEEQVGEEIYRANPLDRGHLVRRLDPAWGATRGAAKLANDDTFHFTNCTPQHEDFNQNKTTWAGLEDYILENADNRDLKVTVFTGPVLAEDDDAYRGVQLPRQFWKVVVMVKRSGELSATGYLLSQERLIDGLEVAPADFSYGEYRTFQVPVRRVEGLTGLSFGDLPAADPFDRMETATTAKEISDPRQLQL
ncbi:DNA/RNA non-specific endonuclease [Nonomuraea jiangxiensis]|uniref:Endonuclease G n=1 Tax=Nonomuraea jiangxiensis TaxID=633440 RepID=A0A1G9DAU3_9ACTN|nr:DNA/RNA non-specific endonuclease [Nonomuraea jiangxiensis]SDK60957.1 endonuclease G [Nonomuraea jiangxiensis]